MENILGQVNVYCFMVERGKPCAMIPIQERHVQKIEEYIKNIFGLNVYTENAVDGWVSLWIYKDKFMLEVIKSLPEKPKTIFEHWVLGKAFGYSDEAIREFLSTKFY